MSAPKVGRNGDTRKRHFHSEDNGRTHYDGEPCEVCEANAIQPKVGRNDMLCPCGSVLSAVTFTCVRGEHCPNYTKPKVGRTVIFADRTGTRFYLTSDEFCTDIPARAGHWDALDARAVCARQNNDPAWQGFTWYYGPADVHTPKIGRNVSQQSRYEDARLALNQFLAKYGNRALFPSTQAEHKLARKLIVLEEAVSDAYWTPEMEESCTLTLAR